MWSTQHHKRHVRHGPFIHIGTSGWSYPHWKRVFYPIGLPSREWLRHYARQFGTVEIDSTFYRLPEAATLRAWRDQVPPDFLFAIKASRFITHMKKLLDPEKTIPPFRRRVETLGRRLGPLLFQLPPRWRADVNRLNAFLRVLRTRHRVAFEFRDPSWLNDEVFDQLQRRGAALCIYDIDGRQSPRVLTADFAYVRLHGPGRAYRGRYGRRRLKAWAEAIQRWRDEGRDVYCYFDNDERGYATRDAAELRSLIGA